MASNEERSSVHKRSRSLRLLLDLSKTAALVALDNAQDVLGATFVPWASGKLTGAIAPLLGEVAEDGWLLSKMMSRRGVDGIILGGFNVIRKAGAKFALRKGLPVEDEKTLAIENEPHSLDGFDGEIKAGYGKGTKKLLFKGPVVLKVKGKQTVTEAEYHVHDADRAGVHFDFAVAGLPEESGQFEVNIGRGPVKGRYAFNKTDRGYIVQRMKDRGLSIPKPNYKLKDESILPTLDSSDYIVERKVDGSLANILIREDRAIIHSHRESASSYYDKLPALEFLDNKSPFFLSRYFFPSPQLHNSILKGELVHEDGTPVVAGILNSAADKARSVQDKIGNVKVELWDIEKLRGKDLRKLPYSERRAILEEVVSDINLFNKNYSAIDKCPASVSFEEFYSQVLNDPRGLPWSEGIVIKKASDPSGEPWMKVKRHDLHDMVIIGYQEGEGKYVGSLGAIVGRDIETGKTVEIGTGFKDFERSWIWNNRDLLGTDKAVVKVKVFKETDQSFHGPRFIQFHESKGGEEGLLLYADVLSGLEGRDEMLSTKYSLINK